MRPARTGAAPHPSRRHSGGLIIRRPALEMLAHGVPGAPTIHRRRGKAIIPVRYPAKPPVAVAPKMPCAPVRDSSKSTCWDSSPIHSSQHCRVPVPEPALTHGVVVGDRSSNRLGPGSPGRSADGSGLALRQVADVNLAEPHVARPPECNCRDAVTRLSIAEFLCRSPR